MERQLLEVLEHNMGFDHPITLKSRNKLMSLLIADGKEEEANEIGTKRPTSVSFDETFSVEDI